MTNLKKHTATIILCIFEIAAGVLLFIDPVSFTSTIISIFGAVILIYGVFTVVGYFHDDPENAMLVQSLAKGLIICVAGGFCLMRAEWFITVFPILTIVYGVALLVAGLVKIQWAADMLRLKFGRWYLPALSAAISIICAIVVLAQPFESTIIIWNFTGIVLIVEAVFDIVVVLMSGREENK